MWHLLAQTVQVNQFWYLVPLILAVSLVYGATRQEKMKEIWYNAYRAAVWILSFMAIIFGVLFVVSWFL